MLTGSGTIDWMSNSTKQKALIKLNAILKKIGYPDKWKDYSTLAIVSNGYAKNVMAADKWAYKHELGKLAKPTDRNRWKRASADSERLLQRIIQRNYFPRWYSAIALL